MTRGYRYEAGKIFNQRMPDVGGARGGRAGGDHTYQQRGRKLP